MNGEAPYPAVVRLVKRFAGVAGNQDLPPTTRLREDLGLDGDDAVEFLNAFAETFGVDMSAFDFGEHFGAESGLGPRTLLRAILPGTRRSMRTKTPVRISDLMEAVSKRQWGPLPESGKRP
jgi:acyl carrier protein